MAHVIDSQKPPHQSPLLTQFYNDYLEWILKKAPQGKPFSRNTGLCGNACIWDNLYGSYLSQQMKIQFIQAQLPFDYPFNDRDNRYMAEVLYAQCHLNEARIQWVLDHSYKV